MPTVRVGLEKPLYDSVRLLAAKEKISLSLKIRDLVKDALEAQEDIVLAKVAEEREKTFRQTRGLTHEQVWVHRKAHSLRRKLTAGRRQSR